MEYFHDATISPEKARELQCAFVLYQFEKGYKFSAFLPGSNNPILNDVDEDSIAKLEDFLQEMFNDDYLALKTQKAKTEKPGIFKKFFGKSDGTVVESTTEYIIGNKGKVLLKRFKQQYQDFLNAYWIFRDVDTDVGGFAAQKIFEMSNERFQLYRNQDNFRDLQFAVIQYKNDLQDNPHNRIDLVQIAFMSMMRDGKLDPKNNPTWIFDLISNLLWEDVIALVKDCFTWQDLSAHPDKDEQLKEAEQIIQAIIEQGTALMQEIHEQENQVQEEFEYDNDDDDDYDYEQIIIVYYEDPYYVAPCWRRY